MIRKDQQLVATHTIGVYQNSPNDAIQYAYFVIDQTTKEIHIL